MENLHLLFTTTERCLLIALPESLPFKKEVTFPLLDPAFSLFTKLVTFEPPPQLLGAALPEMKEVTVRDFKMLLELEGVGRLEAAGVAPVPRTTEGVAVFPSTLLKGFAAGLGASLGRGTGLNAVTGVGTGAGAD